jgi:hypothetical protein
MRAWKCGELRDKGEDQPCKPGEQALVMSKEDPQGLGQGDDELSVGEGKEQALRYPLHLAGHDYHGCGTPTHERSSSIGCRSLTRRG